MEFLDTITDHLKIIVGLTLFFLFLLFVLYMWGEAGSTYSKVISKIGTSERALLSDNITLGIEYKELILDVPKVYENNIIIKTRQAHTLKFILYAKSSNIFFEGRTTELTKPVMGSMVIPIYIDVSSRVIKAQNVTVSVFILDDNKEKFLENITFEVKPGAGLFLRLYPNEDTTIIGVFDTQIPESTLNAVRRLVNSLDDITALNGQILMYMESRFDDNIIVSIDVTAKSNYKTDESYGKIYVLLPSGTVKSLSFNVVDESTQKVVIQSIPFRRKGEFLLMIPELKVGVYYITLNIKVYYYSVSEENYLADKIVKLKVASFPGEGFIITQAVSLVVPYSVQENSDIWDLLLELMLPAGTVIGLNDKGYHLIGFIDSGVAYTPMPDTTLTERVAGTRYNVDVYSRELYNRKLTVVKFFSKDNFLRGIVYFYKVSNGNTINVYIFRYYIINDELTNEAFCKSADNFKLLEKWLAGLTSDLDNKEYFPLFYSQDALVVVSKFGTKISNIEYGGAIHTVCITNNALPPTNFVGAFLEGDVSFLDTNLDSLDSSLPTDYVYKFNFPEGYDCADDTKYVDEYLRTELKTETIFQTTYLLEMHYLFAYKTYNTNVGEFFSYIWDTIQELLGKKLSMGDEINQERFVEMLLFPDKFVASKNLAIVNYYTIKYQKGEYTVRIHVYSYVNYPLDKARELAKETCLQLTNNDTEICGG